GNNLAVTVAVEFAHLTSKLCRVIREAARGEREAERASIRTGGHSAIHPLIRPRRCLDSVTPELPHHLAGHELKRCEGLRRVTLPRLANSPPGTRPRNILIAQALGQSGALAIDHVIPVSRSRSRNLPVRLD